MHFFPAWSSPQVIESEQSWHKLTGQRKQERWEQVRAGSSFEKPGSKWMCGEQFRRQTR